MRLIAQRTFAVGGTAQSVPLIRVIAKALQCLFPGRIVSHVVPGGFLLAEPRKQGFLADLKRGPAQLLTFQSAVFRLSFSLSKHRPHAIPDRRVRAIGQWAQDEIPLGANGMNTDLN